LNDTFGNFVHRTLTFIYAQFKGEIPKQETIDADTERILGTLRERVEKIADEIESCKLQSAANTLLSISRIGNQYLNEKEPWNLIKQDQAKAANIFHAAAQYVKALAIVSCPFVPFAAEQIWKTLSLPGDVNKQSWDEALKPFPHKHKIIKPQPLFGKINANKEEIEERLGRIREALGKTNKT
jgi:methionyl-tRNA synthetase